MERWEIISTVSGRTIAHVWSIEQARGSVATGYAFATNDDETQFLLHDPRDGSVTHIYV
jgi:hypothetical protein